MTCLAALRHPVAIHRRLLGARFLVCLLFVPLRLLLASDCAAAPWQMEAEFEHGLPNDGYGYSVSLDGDLALVGTQYGDGIWMNTGSAIAYERSDSGWRRTATLFALDSAGTEFDWFGRALDLDGNRAVIGAEANSRPGLEFTGAAYVFDRIGGTWSQSQKLTASDAAPADQFGSSVAVSASRVVVGAERDDIAGMEDAGSAYVYDRAPSGIWTQTTKLIPTDSQARSRFGDSIALSDEWAFVGAPYAGRTNFEQGAVYVFHHDAAGWRQTQRLVPAGARSNDRFGSSLTVDGNRLIAGSPTYSTSEQYSGAAYIFELVGDQWIESAMLQAQSPRRDDNFGFSVDLSGDRAIVGAVGLDPPDHGGDSVGGALIFQLDAGVWTQVDTLYASSPVFNEGFGEAVAIDGQRALVGTSHHPTTAGENAGLAAFYVVPEPDSAVLAFLGAMTLLASIQLRARSGRSPSATALRG